MRPGTFMFKGDWMPTVQNLRETGMGYTVVSIRLCDGREFKQVVIDSGHLARVRGDPRTRAVRPGLPADPERLAAQITGKFHLAAEPARQAL